MGRLQGRVALITGASRGIGGAVARRYAQEGARLILAARNTAGLEEVDDAVRSAGGEAATLVPLDLTDFTQIDRLGQAVYERFGRLDILVGNAGRLETLGPVGHFDPAAWQRLIDVNLTANFRLIRSFDRLLRASEAGRAIFVTSGAAGVAHPFWGPYAASKAALEVLVKTYAREVAGSPLRVNLIDPGVVRTSMRAAAFPGENPDNLPEADTVTDLFVELAEKTWTGTGEVLSAGG